MWYNVGVAPINHEAVLFRTTQNRFAIKLSMPIRCARFRGGDINIEIFLLCSGEIEIFLLCSGEIEIFPSLVPAS